MTKATSVNPSALSALQYINSTGRTPKNDNSDVVAVLTQGFNNSTGAIVTELQSLGERVKSLEDTTRKTNTQRRVPGSEKRAA
jgi:hypothetical protein